MNMHTVESNEVADAAVQGNGFGGGGLAGQHMIGGQGGFQSLEAQRQQYAAQLGQLAMLAQRTGGGGAFPHGFGAPVGALLLAAHESTATALAAVPRG